MKYSTQNLLSYRESHKSTGKGLSYDKYYAEDSWAKFLWKREQDVLSLILNEYLSEQEVHLLDFACGTGRLTRYLEDKVASATGVDVSQEMLSVARKKVRRARLLEADLTKTSVLNGQKFNLITAFRFFLNAEPELRLAAMKSLSALLEPDGILVLNNHRNLTSPFVRAIRTWQKLTREEISYKVMSSCEVNDLVQRAGLEIMTIFPVGYVHPIRLSLSQEILYKLENAALSCSLLRSFSESPIIVCRHSH